MGFNYKTPFKKWIWCHFLKKNEWEIFSHTYADNATSCAEFFKKNKSQVPKIE